MSAFPGRLSLPVLFSLGAASCLLLLLYAQGSLLIGYAVLSAPGTPPAASALFSFSNAEGVLVWEAGVASTEPLRAGRIFVDQQGTRTAVALANPQNETVTARLTLRDAAGNSISVRTDTFEPRRHRSLFVDELFPALPKAFSGSLSFEVLEPSLRLAAVTLRENTNALGESVYATLPVVDLNEPADPGQLILPQVGAGAGELATQIVLINRSGGRIRGRITLISSAGTPLRLRSGQTIASEFPYTLEAHGTSRLLLDNPAGIAAGYAVLASEQGTALPNAGAIFQYLSAGSLVSEAGVAAVPATTRARLFVDTVNTQTGFALANPGAAEAVVRMKLIERSGLETAAAQRVLPPRGHLAVFVEQIFSNLPPGYTGLLELSADSPFVPVTLKLSTNRRGQPVLTTLPLADLTRPTAGLRVFPQIGIGLGFSTRLVLLSHELQSSTSGTLTFYNPDGSDMLVPLSGASGNRFDYQLAAGGGRQLRPGNTAVPARILADASHPDLLEMAVNTGNSLRLKPQVIDSAGAFRDDFPLTFSTTNPQVATVDPGGLLRGVSQGFSTLLIASGGAVFTGTVTVAAVTAGAGGWDVNGVTQDLAQRVYLTSSSVHVILRSEQLGLQPEVYAGVAGQPGLVDAARLQALFQLPAFLAYNHLDGTLFVSDTANHALRRIRPDPAGRTDTLAGAGQAGSRDGPLKDASFNRPAGIALDGRGRLWIADSGNHVIRRLDLVGGTVETVAGRAGSPGLQNGSGAQARFNSPAGLALEVESPVEQLRRESRGEPPPPVRVIVADSGNGLLRRVDENGLVETLEVAASPGPAETGLAAPAAARFDDPAGVAVDSTGTIYVTEPDGGNVRALLPNGTVVSAAQAGTFARPRGIAVSAVGRILVADSGRSGHLVAYGRPEIAQISPSVSPDAGGARVTIKGRNFAPETTLTISGVAITDFQLTDTETVVFTTPPLPSGLGTLSLQNRAGVAQAPFMVQPVAPQDLPAGYITTIAGGSTFAGDGSLGIAASVTPFRLAVDPGGDLYMSDFLTSRIRKLDTESGIVTTVAGNGSLGFSEDGGLATASALAFPFDVTVDPSGNVIICDTFSGRVRQVQPATGLLTTIAGGGAPDDSLGDGGPAREALLIPSAAEVAANGDLYIADVANARIRRVDRQTGRISTVAGNGDPDSYGDGGPALQAALFPWDILLDLQGNVYVVDSEGESIRRIDAQTGVIDTVAGSGDEDYSGDGGPAVEAGISPTAIAWDPVGNLLIGDSNQRVRQVDLKTGIITTVAGNGRGGFSGDGGPAIAARLAAPNGIAVDAAGHLFIGDTDNRRVRVVNARSQVITTLVGNGTSVYTGDGGPAVAAGLSYPDFILIGPQDELFISDLATIRRVDPKTGHISTIAGNGEFDYTGDRGPARQAALNAPSGLARDSSGNLYIADTENHVIRRVSPGGTISTVAGSGEDGYNGDGLPARQAQLSSPSGLAIDATGALLIVDAGNQMVRRLDFQSGRLFDLVGDGDAGFAGDGGIATEARLNEPRGLAVDSKGNLYIADSGNARIRRVDAASRIITTVAGTGQPGYSGDGGPATNAQLTAPVSVHVDAGGNLFIGDLFVVRYVDADSKRIRTLAGGRFGVGDGGPATAAGLSAAHSLALDSAGNLYICDITNSRVRLVRAPFR